MLTLTPQVARELHSAFDWAEAISFAFAECIGDTLPFAIEPGVDQHGDAQLTIAGVVVNSDWRHKEAADLAKHVASKLAAPIAYRSTLEWFDYQWELIGFIGWMHAEHFVADPDGFQRWVAELRSRPAKWTLEYIAYRSLCG